MFFSSRSQHLQLDWRSLSQKVSVRNTLVEFIEIYRSEPCLWKMDSKEYRDRRKKSEAYRRLVEKLREIEPDADRALVVRKINNLRTAYRKELKKCRSAEKTGEPYEPKLWYFDRFRFLIDQEMQADAANDSGSESVENSLSNSQLLPKQEPNPEPYETPPTSHVLLQNIKTEVILPDEYDTSEQQQPQHYHTPDATASTSVPPEPLLPAPIMVWGSTENPPGVDATCHSIAQTVEKDCNEQQHQQPFKKSRVELLNSTEDRFDVFAKNVALKLREMDKTQRILVEKIINDALFEGEMGMLTRHHRLVDMSQNKDFLTNEEGV